MSVSSSRYPLIRISKTGEMRLRNKVGQAILKENAYEDRALNTRLDTLSKHQFRQDKYMTYRQLEFATKQVSASEERPRTLSNESKQSSQSTEQSLPPIDSRRRSNIVAPNLDEKRMSHSEEVSGNYKAKGRWEKAITLVRLAVQNRPVKEANTKPTGRTRKVSKKQASEVLSAKDLDDANPQLPPINSKEGILGDQPCSRKRPIRKQPSLPEMLKISREKSQNCLADPRFMKLEQCLSETKNFQEGKQRRNSRTNAWDRIPFTR